VRADCTKDGYTCKTILVEDDFHGVILCRPGMRGPHPRVEARLVKVDNRSLFVDHLSELCGELQALLLKLLLERCMVCCRHSVELDVVSLVEKE